MDIMAVGLIDRMQTQRFELKYLIKEPQAKQVSDFVKSYLDLDEYSAIAPGLSYPVHSLYLDSDQATTYWETINGNKNRYKLRLRYYSVEPGAPVFFEIKRRMNNCILKQRGGVKLEAVSAILNRQFPQFDHLLSQDAKSLVAVQKFSELMSRLDAKPKVHIAYLREAYVSSDDRVRVTMDRQVRGEPNFKSSIKTEMVRPAISYEKDVILELKFTDRFPNWFKELVRIFNVTQCGAAKYVSLVQGLGEVSLKFVTPIYKEGYTRRPAVWPED
jgi:hypothetical protein